MLQFLWITSPSGLRLMPSQTRKQKLLRSSLSKTSFVSMEYRRNSCRTEEPIFSQLDARDLSVVGCEKINTSGYHPQTDGLVEKFNSTLINMIAKSCETKGRDWNEHLPYLLFAYRVSSQHSTKESPFFLLYVRDPRITMETMLFHVCSLFVVGLDEYKESF